MLIPVAQLLTFCCNYKYMLVYLKTPKIDGNSFADWFVWQCQYSGLSALLLQCDHCNQADEERQEVNHLGINHLEPKMLGTLKKMRGQLPGNDDNNDTVQYALPVGDEFLPLNPLIGKTFKFTHTGKILCSNCGKKTKKSYSQGHCYVCMQKLASCDMCILKPETCHFEQGTCREPDWGEANCMTHHFVYLSNTSGLKVGITRHSQVPTRWIDQGATQALPIFKVATRLQSGMVETAMAELIADKTNWRALLKGQAEPLDLKAKAQELIPQIATRLDEVKLKFGEDAVTELNADVLDIRYPVLEYPTKITSFNMDKNPEVSGTLMGIKGQYLIFDNGVINIRKFGSYEVEVEV